MAAALEVLKRPPATADVHQKSRYRTAGIVLGLVGVMVAMVTLIANSVAGAQIDDGASGAQSAIEILGWSFGLTTTAFAIIKIGIAVTLAGLLVRLWMRVDSLKAALPDLKGPGSGAAPRLGDYVSPFGKATASMREPKPFFIHTVARRAWFPALAMGAMGVVAGLVISLVWAGNAGTGTGRTAAAWTQGTQFLGEAMLLGGISFLLGSILASIRSGGGEVQESVGATVKSLRMPISAKLFIGLMAAGMMVAAAQFVLYGYVAVNNSLPAFAVWSAWLGPLRELSLGLLLAGIVLALYTIGNALSFQFYRIKELIGTEEETR